MTAKIKLNAASGGGSFSLQAPSSSSNTRVMTLPDTADGTILTTTNPKSGNIIQVVSTTKTAVASNSTAAGALFTYNDASLRATITASSASNFFKITGQIVVGSNGLAVNVILFDNGSAVTTTGALGDASGSTRRSLGGTDNGNTEGVATIPVHVYISCADTNEHKFHYAFYHNGGGTNDINLNRPHSGTDSNKRGRYISNITVQEVAA
tara:strand:+ start:876 stop:1502 length:627 start_codon:yes stop_codon:yes gene_type:complete